MSTHGHVHSHTKVKGCTHCTSTIFLHDLCSETLLKTAKKNWLLAPNQSNTNSSSRRMKDCKQGYLFLTGEILLDQWLQNHGCVTPGRHLVACLGGNPNVHVEHQTVCGFNLLRSRLWEVHQHLPQVTVLVWITATQCQGSCNHRYDNQYNHINNTLTAMATTYTCTIFM